MRTYTEWLLDSMCFEEWQDAIDAEIDAMPDVEMSDEHLEDTLDLESWMDEVDWIRSGC